MLERAIAELEHACTVFLYAQAVRGHAKAVVIFIGVVYSINNQMFWILAEYFVCNE